jgi:hypothetical protein
MTQMTLPSGARMSIRPAVTARPWWWISTLSPGESVAQLITGSGVSLPGTARASGEQAVMMGPFNVQMVAGRGSGSQRIRTPGLRRTGLVL